MSTTGRGSCLAFLEVDLFVDLLALSLRVAEEATAESKSMFLLSLLLMLLLIVIVKREEVCLDFFFSQF